MSAAVTRVAGGLAILLAAVAVGRDWPHVRGPAYTGTATPQVCPNADLNPRVTWRTEVGEGFSGCVVADGRLFTQGQTAAGQFVICLDPATGIEVWRRRIEWAWEPGGRYPGPFATPTYAEGRVHYSGAYGSVGCLEARTGRPEWSVDLVVDHGIERPGFGYACTPLCRAGAVFVYGGERGPSLFAFEARTGRLLWRTGTDASAYNSPIPVCVGDFEQIVLFHQNAIAGYNSASGRCMWRQPWSRGYDPHPAWLLSGESLLFCAAPFRRGSAAFRLEPADAAPQAEAVWRSSAVSQDILSGALFDGHVYGFDIHSAQAEATLRTRGRLSCMELATGRVLWSTPHVGHASVIVANGRLIIVEERGDLVVADADPSAYRELARLAVLPGERCWTAPAAAGGRIYVRGERTVAAVSLSGADDGAAAAGAPASAPPRPMSAPAAAFVEPAAADLLRWGMAGFVLVSLAAGIRAAMPAAGTVTGGSTFLLASLGLAALLAGLWPKPLFLWPVGLYAALFLAVQTRAIRRSGIAPRLALLLFIGVCAVCMWDCRRRGIPIAPAFLTGFAASLPLILPVTPSAPTVRRRLVDAALVSAGFAAYYAACAAFLVWRTP